MSVHVFFLGDRARALVGCFCKRKNVLIKLGLLLLIAAMSGCAGPKRTSPERTAEHALTRSTATTSAPIYLNVTRGTIDDYLAQVKVLQWQSETREGRKSKIHRSILNGTPYLVATSRVKEEKPPVLVPLSSVERVEFFDQDLGFRAEIRAGGRLIESTRDVRIAVCDAAVKEPTLSNCLVAQEANMELRTKAGSLYNYRFAISDRYVHDTFNGLIGALKTQSGPVTIAGNHSQNPDAQFAAYVANAKMLQAARNEEERVKQAEREKANQARLLKVLRDSPRGTVIFCSSGSHWLVLPGKPLSEVAFYCDLTGSKEPLFLRAMMSHGWNIESEMRTAEETMRGQIGHVVSLRLRKG